MTNGTTYNIDLRGVTSGGISNASIIHIAYSPGAGPDPKHILLTGGSTTTHTDGTERMSVGLNVKGTIHVGFRTPASTDRSISDAMTTKTGSHVTMGPVAQ